MKLRSVSSLTFGVFLRPAVRCASSQMRTAASAPACRTPSAQRGAGLVGADDHGPPDWIPAALRDPVSDVLGLAPHRPRDLGPVDSAQVCCRIVGDRFVDVRLPPFRAVAAPVRANGESLDRDPVALGHHFVRGLQLAHQSNARAEDDRQPVGSVGRLPGRGERAGDPVADARLAGAARHHDAAAGIGRAPALVRPSTDVLQSLERRVDDAALDLVPRVGICVVRSLRRLQQLVLKPQAPNLGEPPVIQLLPERLARPGRSDDPSFLELRYSSRVEEPLDILVGDRASPAPRLALDRDQPFARRILGHQVDGDVFGRAAREDRRAFPATVSTGERPQRSSV